MIEDEEDGVTSSLPDRHRTFRKASSKSHLTNRLDTLAKHDVDIRTSLKSSHEADTKSHIINKKIKVCVDVAYVTNRWKHATVICIRHFEPSKVTEHKNNIPNQPQLRKKK